MRSRPSSFLDFISPGDHEADMAATAALTQLDTLFWAAPSVREALTDEVIADAYRNARERIAGTSGMDVPAKCPFTRERVLDAIEAVEFTS